MKRPLDIDEITPEKIAELKRKGLKLRRKIHEELKPLTNVPWWLMQQRLKDKEE